MSEINLDCDGKLIHVVISNDKTGNVAALDGILEYWNTEEKILVVTAVADNGVPSQQRHVINWVVILRKCFLC